MDFIISSFSKTFSWLPTSSTELLGCGSLQVSFAFYLNGDCTDMFSDRRNLDSLVTVVETELTSSVSRVRKGKVRPPWNMNKCHPGVLFPDQDLIASGVNGSMFHLTLLDGSSLRLLRYIQDLYKTKEKIRRYNPPEIGNTEHDPQLSHVDGDVLATILKFGNEWLRETVTRAERGCLMPKFRELAGRVLNISEEADPIDVVMGYMDVLVHSVVL
jgi:hypothetical protein